MIPRLPQTPFSCSATINSTGEARAANLPTPKGWAIAAARHRSGVPSGLSRFASQAKPLLTIAGHALTLAILLACLVLPAIFAGA